MILLKLSPQDVEKCKMAIEKMNQERREKKIWSYPSFSLPYEKGLLEEKVKKLLSFPLVISKEFSHALSHTIWNMFKKINAHQVHFSSVNYEGVPFPIYCQEEYTKKYMLYGEMYVNIDIHTCLLSLDILPYPSPREIMYNDIAWLQSSEAEINIQAYMDIINMDISRNDEMYDVYLYMINPSIMEIIKKYNSFLSSTLAHELVNDIQYQEELLISCKLPCEMSYGVKFRHVENEEIFLRTVKKINHLI